ncbi:hypothetical protein G5S34_04590 [Herbaspirillum frisingense]|nr:hypothetical protein [Herbaspirillum frisingense]QNB06118.1 hypothetical protein G5S34_04590 [Herbaspirillum frisingense]
MSLHEVFRMAARNEGALHEDSLPPLKNVFMRQSIRISKRLFLLVT